MKTHRISPEAVISLGIRFNGTPEESIESVAGGVVTSLEERHLDDDYVVVLPISDPEWELLSKHLRERRRVEGEIMSIIRRMAPDSVEHLSTSYDPSSGDITFTFSPKKK